MRTLLLLFYSKENPVIINSGWALMVGLNLKFVGFWIYITLLVLCKTTIIIFVSDESPPRKKVRWIPSKSMDTYLWVFLVSHNPTFLVNWDFPGSKWWWTNLSCFCFFFAVRRRKRKRVEGEIWGSLCLEWRCSSNRSNQFLWPEMLTRESPGRDLLVPS